MPTVFGKALMAGAVKEKEIFLMLIEKALAKSCGSYENIPQDLDNLLEILFCGPLRKSKILELSEREKVKATI